VYDSSPQAFREDLRNSLDVIQNVTQNKVRAYRAPGFSITKESLWAFDILAEEGIEIDSSIFPASRAHGGIKDFNYDHPFRIKTANKVIKEFPLSIFRVGRTKIPFSGGGYFRIFPFIAINYFCKRSDYVMTYFHPRDFDPEQPLLKELPMIRKLKSYLGLKKSIERFREFLTRYEFVDIDFAVNSIEWDKMPLIEI
jgi:hypothetical protein